MRLREPVCQQARVSDPLAALALFVPELGRPPEGRHHRANGWKPRLRRVLEAIPVSWAIGETATWDVVT